MLKRLAVLGGVVALASVVAAPAGAAAPKAKTRAFSLSFQAAVLANVANTDAGIVTGSLGKGAIVIVGATTGRVTVYYPGGTLSGTFNITATTNPDMSASFTGKTTLKSGTGDYAGATGSGTLSGTIAADGSVTGTAKGKITS
jgi:hypothetical protein